MNENRVLYGPQIHGRQTRDSRTESLLWGSGYLIRHRLRRFAVDGDNRFPRRGRDIFPNP